MLVAGGLPNVRARGRPAAALAACSSRAPCCFPRDLLVARSLLVARHTAKSSPTAPPLSAARSRRNRALRSVAYGSAR